MNAVRFQRDADAVLAAAPHQLQRKVLLHQRLAAGKRHAAVLAVVFLILQHDLHDLVRSHTLADQIERLHRARIHAFAARLTGSAVKAVFAVFSMLWQPFGQAAAHAPQRTQRS